MQDRVWLVTLKGPLSNVYSRHVRWERAGFDAQGREVAEVTLLDIDDARLDTSSAALERTFDTDHGVASYRVKDAEP